jgi:hypothetical protein
LPEDKMRQENPSENRLILLTNKAYRQMIIPVQFFRSIRVRLVKEKSDTKVFCIGFSKTGTSSLYNALDILGYRALDWPRAHIRPKYGWIEYFKKSKFDAFTDAPLYQRGLFKKLDKEFPNSKFILTIRKPESLVKSWENYFRKAPWNIDSEEDKKTIIKKYNDHKKDVLEYFKDKPDKLLVYDLIGGDGWEKLCKFLGKSVPDAPFPHKRKAIYKK